MTKKSQRRPLRYDKDQAGCIWGFISFFDFRHGRISRRILSDRSRFTRQIVGAGCSIPTQHKLTNSYANQQIVNDGEEQDIIIADTSRTSVKELMNKEMFVEDDRTGQILNANIETREPELEHNEKVKKKRRRKRKASKSVGNIQSEINTPPKIGAHSSSQPSIEDMKIVAKDILHQIYQNNTTIVKDGSCNETESLVEQKSHLVDKKLSEAIRLFVDRRSKDGKIDYSKEFMDALETLSLNKEVILEMLKEPNSVLVKHIENLEASHLEKGKNEDLTDKSKFLNGDLNNLKKRHNFFRRRSKSEEKIRLSLDDNCEAPNRIVILKPGLSIQSPDFLENGVRSERNGSHFSFTEIKRRLKNAMGKEKNSLPMIGNANKVSYERQNSGGEKAGWNSPNRNHFYIEKFAKPANGGRNKDTFLKPKSSETTNMNDSVENNEERISNLYIEAKRHLSEMLSQGDDIGDLSNKPSPKALGKMISIPGYNFNFSPLNSPRENEHRLITAKQRLTPQSSFNENKSKLNPENNSELHDKSDALDDLNHTFLEGDTLSSMKSEIKSAGDVAKEVEIVEKSDYLPKDEREVSDVPAEELSSLPFEEIQVDGRAEACDEAVTVESLEQEQLLSSPLTSLPSYSKANNIGDIDTGDERLERPSPVSVLEPIFSENDISPAGIKTQSAEPLMQPLRIQFEEQFSSTVNQELYASACLDDEESPFEYVEAVLLASDLNINEFRRRWLLSNTILDPSLFSEVELFSSRSSEDQKLLFDCTNEVLNEVCEGYFGYFPRVSFVKHDVRSIPKGMDLINEIWNKVEWHILKENSLRTLDYVVKKTLKRDEKWMDLRPDVEGIAFAIGDAIFEELLEDFLSSFTDDSHETGSSMFPETCIEIE